MPRLRCFASRPGDSPHLGVTIVVQDDLMGLTRLVYVSCSGRPVRLEEAETIAKCAAARNAAVAISGFLLYTPGHFMQALEGEPAVVDATFARIARDPRHHRVQRLCVGPVEQRRFAAWSMGFAFFGPAERRSELEPDAWQSSDVLALLRKAATWPHYKRAAR